MIKAESMIERLTLHPEKTASWMPLSKAGSSSLAGTLNAAIAGGWVNALKELGVQESNIVSINMTAGITIGLGALSPIYEVRTHPECIARSPSHLVCLLHVLCSPRSCSSAVPSNRAADHSRL